VKQFCGGGVDNALVRDFIHSKHIADRIGGQPPYVHHHEEVPMSFDTNLGHVRFALAVAFAKLEQLVWDFDIHSELQNRTFVGLPQPNELSSIIEQFLGEPEIFAGDKRRLQQLKSDITSLIQPAFLAGQTYASSRWLHSTAEERESLSLWQPIDVLTAARSVLHPTYSPTESSWFTEGFCRTWWEVEYVAYVLGNNDTTQ
jgi:hypothetical protein